MAIGLGDYLMSETTHLICAHCGGDNPVKNYLPDSHIKVAVVGYGVFVYFMCEFCNEEYKLVEPHTTSRALGAICNQHEVKMKKIFCFLGLHSWVSWQEWIPSFNAPIVTKVTFFRKCFACGKTNDIVMNFDKKTGSPIESVG